MAHHDDSFLSVVDGGSQPETPERFIDPMEMDRPDTYGFRWGPAVIYRDNQYEMGTNRTTRVVRVQPDQGPAVDIHISSTGKSIRVFKDGNELT